MSGMYDVTLVPLSYINDKLQMRPSETVTASPHALVPRIVSLFPHTKVCE